MNKLRVRLALLFILIITVSSFVAFVAMLIFAQDSVSQDELNVFVQSDIARLLHIRSGIMSLSIVMIGSLIIILVGKKTILPITNLTKAAQEVAKGNFDVKVEYKKKGMIDEIRLLTDNFNKMSSELKSIEILRKDFINNVSHEFKTPIASIQGFAELLQNPELNSAERDEYTKIIIEETQRLTKISSNILRLSKLESQGIIIKSDVFSLDEQIRRVIVFLEPEWSKKNIAFDLQLEKINLVGDQELLYQVWMNLIYNAIKFSGDNGIIYVEVSRKDDFAFIEIKDSGIGMDEVTQKRIFEKFYQGDTTHSTEGNGLGLSIANQIVILSGGKISVKSNVGIGTTITIELPLFE